MHTFVLCKPIVGRGLQTTNRERNECRHYLLILSLVNADSTNGNGTLLLLFFLYAAVGGSCDYEYSVSEYR